MLRSFALLMLSLACLGCGSSATLPVHGTVTYGDQPVDGGILRFVPIEGTEGPVNAGTIAAGKYCIEERGGVTPGKYRVEIDAWKNTGRKSSEYDRDGRPPKLEERVKVGAEIYSSQQSPLRIEVAKNSNQPIDIRIPQN